ncbi:Peptidyl-tRNA hydrolase [gamma proteobacterium HdN1]|nr:Peptidyl-tRNA hydrolase [gamma proteobacterium HdN1]
MSAPIQLIVGLGNPGQQYEHTRHNAGAWLVERLASQFRTPLKHEARFSGATARIDIDGHDVRLLIPSTFMNLSGQAVGALASFYRIAPDAMVVAHDELDLPPGIIKLKTGGGHGGHNGLRDIVAKLGNNNGFHRLRIGIGHPGSSDRVTGHVLSKASSAEQKLIDAAIDEALAVFPSIAAGELGRAMNRLNAFKG